MVHECSAREYVVVHEYEWCTSVVHDSARDSGVVHEYGVIHEYGVVHENEWCTSRSGVREIGARVRGSNSQAAGSATTVEEA